MANALGAIQCEICGTPKPPVNYIIPEGKTAVYLCEGSLVAALEGCSRCAALASQLWLSEGVRGAISLVRPPGHHAMAESFGSYCLLNNVAITAQHLLQGGVSGLAPPPERLLILDWDVHHGDGTQALVDGIPSLREGCVFVSIHRHDAEFWPKSGTVEESTERTVNIPLRGQGFGDADYLYVFTEVILPLAEAFQPDLILVSAGYDCAEGDALGRFSVTPDGFEMMTRLCLGIAKALFILEGGYDVEENLEEPHGPLCRGVAATVQGLLEGPLPEGEEGLPEGWRDRVRAETLDVVEQVHNLVGSSEHLRTRHAVAPPPQ